MSMYVDLNCDVGEATTPDALSREEALLNHVTSANIACGVHAGDPSRIKHLVKACGKAGVAIGAHPGLPDRGGMGRRMMDLTPEQIYDLVLYQLGALSAFTKAAELKLNHVKPHGALYNSSAVDAKVANSIAAAVHDFDRQLVLVGLAGSCSLAAAKQLGLKSISEAFADRNYEADGTLTPRTEPDAVIHDPELAAARAAGMVSSGRVVSRQGTTLDLVVETICIHGDTPTAANLARILRMKLSERRISLRAM